MKKFTLTISVDEDKLKQSYYLSQDTQLEEQDLPSIPNMIQQEFGWLEAFGISLIGEVQEKIPTSSSEEKDKNSGKYHFPWKRFLKGILKNKPRKQLVEKKSFLTEEQLQKLSRALESKPSDGGVWNATKVAHWVEKETGG